MQDNAPRPYEGAPSSPIRHPAEAQRMQENKENLNLTKVRHFFKNEPPRYEQTVQTRRMQGVEEHPKPFEGAPLPPPRQPADAQSMQESAEA